MKSTLLTLAFFFTLSIVSAQTLSVTANNDTAICVGDTLLLEAFVSGGTPPYTYDWNIATWVECYTCASTLAFSDSTTTYMITVTDSVGAIVADYVTVTIDTPVIVSGNGLLNVEVFGFATDIADSIVFTADSSFNQGGTWTVELQGGYYDSISQNGISFAYSRLQDFCIAVKDPWNCFVNINMCYTPDSGCTTYCMDTSILIGYVGGSISEKNTLLVNVSPNPVKDRFTISSTIYNEAEIRLYNTFGQLMLRQESMGLVDEQMDIGDLSSGTYILHIQTQDGFAVHRIMKN